MGDRKCPCCRDQSIIDDICEQCYAKIYVSLIERLASRWHGVQAPTGFYITYAEAKSLAELLLHVWPAERLEAVRRYCTIGWDGLEERPDGRGADIDFVFLRDGRLCALEFKTRGPNDLSQTQLAVLTRLRKMGADVYVCSLDGVSRQLLLPPTVWGRETLHSVSTCGLMVAYRQDIVRDQPVFTLEYYGTPYEVFKQIVTMGVLSSAA